MDAGQFQRQPVGDHPLFAAGVDKQQVFLTILEKPEIAARVALFRGHLEGVETVLLLEELQDGLAGEARGVEASDLTT